MPNDVRTADGRAPIQGTKPSRRGRIAARTLLPKSSDNTGYIDGERRYRVPFPVGDATD